MKSINPVYAQKLKTAKWLFAIAVLWFVAKPFVGFTFHTSNIKDQRSILVKSFAKRKHEYIENSKLDAKTVAKQLVNPPAKSILLFSCLLGILFPLLFRADLYIAGGFIRQLKLSLLPPSDPWLLHCQLII